MESKAAYRQYASEHTVSLYLHPDWLEKATERWGDWDVVFSKDEKGEIQGFWVFVYKSQLIWSKITMPAFTPYMGPCLIYPEIKSEYERRSFENKVLKDLIRQVPPFAEIRFKWQHGYDNWLPFYWQSFQQQTAYTYIIRDTSHLETVFKSFKSSIQRQIRKAAAQLKVRSATEITEVVRMLRKSLGKQADKIVDEPLLAGLHQVTQAHKRGMILEALDPYDRVIAAIYLIWDEREVMYLYGGYDDTYNDSGAMPLLFWQAIRLAHQKQLSFNFEGSMIPGVEKFFRSFGAELTPVSFIVKRGFPYRFLTK